MEKRAAHEKEKYQPSYDTTVLTEVCGCLRLRGGAGPCPPAPPLRRSFGHEGSGKIGRSMGMMFLVKSAGKILSLNWGSLSDWFPGWGLE